ncbi:hypothetical protein PSPO01_01163 [Paraphaeosphaeria sporulosa]
MEPYTSTSNYATYPSSHLTQAQRNLSQPPTDPTLSAPRSRPTLSALSALSPGSLRAALPHRTARSTFRGLSCSSPCDIVTGRSDCWDGAVPGLWPGGNLAVGLGWLRRAYGGGRGGGVTLLWVKAVKHAWVRGGVGAGGGV